MAILYPRKDSSVWWLKYRDPDTGKTKCSSTGLRRDDPKQTILAKELRAKFEARELNNAAKVLAVEPWEVWVPAFFKRHFNNALTRQRYATAWTWLSYWLQLEKISSPEQVTYKQAITYMDWRTTYRKRTGKVAGWNTALFELKAFSLIMGEAMHLGFIPANPLAKLGVRRQESAQKPAMTDEEVETIRRALSGEPEWMQISFEIGLHTGCRLRETIIELANVDFDRNEILFATPKGGRDRAFRIPIPDELRPMFTDMKRRRRRVTLEMPFQPSRRWGQFFEKLAMTHLCFHCLRVTYITRLWKRGVPREQAMALVNHASDLVHRIYLRSDAQDLREAQRRAAYPANPFPSAATPQNPTNTPYQKTRESRVSDKAPAPGRSSRRTPRRTPPR